jgi:hypothetical protein
VAARKNVKPVREGASALAKNVALSAVSLAAFLLLAEVALTPRHTQPPRPPPVILDPIVSIRSFTMNAVAYRTAARLGVPVVYTPLAFEESDDPSLFFPDRYPTRAAGYALVAHEVEKLLMERELFGNAPVPDSEWPPLSSPSGRSAPALRAAPKRGCSQGTR